MKLEAMRQKSRLLNFDGCRELYEKVVKYNEYLNIYTVCCLCMHYKEEGPL